MELKRSTIAPLLERLANDSSARVRSEVAARVAPAGRHPTASPAEAFARIARDLPDDPRLVQTAVASTGDTAPLPELLSIIERIRERERTEPADRRMEWTTARAAVHHALAKRGSRIALYDLRESLGAAREPLPVEFVSALSAIGDASCLEPIAGAYAHAGGRAASSDDWWRRHLAEAFRTIVAREKITRRHAVMKRIARRWDGALEQLWAGGAGKAGGAGTNHR